MKGSRWFIFLIACAWITLSLGAIGAEKDDEKKPPTKTEGRK